MVARNCNSPNVRICGTVSLTFVTFLRFGNGRTFVFLTNRKRWTALQRRMMHQADRFHMVRTGILVVLTLTMAISLSMYVGTVRNRALVERIQTAVETMANSRGIIVPHAIEDLEEYPPEMVSKELRSRFAESKPSQKLALACTWRISTMSMSIFWFPGLTAHRHRRRTTWQTP